jgi:uncharacterized protein involved in exopolysaccharide biosynthesis
MSMQTKNQFVSMRELLVFYYRHRRRLRRAFIVPFLLFVVVSFVPAPRYEASSVLIVRLGSEYVYQPEVGSSANAPESTIPFDQTQIFKSEVAILSSDDLHEEVIKTVGIEKMYPEMFRAGLLDPVRNVINGVLDSLIGNPPETPQEIAQHRMANAVLRFDKRLDIELEKESAVISVTFQHKDQGIAVQALDTLLKLYLEKRKVLFIDPRANMARAQVEETRAKAIAAEKVMEDFKQRNSIYSLPDQRANLLTARAEVQKMQSTVSSPALVEKMAYYNRQLDELDRLDREFSKLERETQITSDEYALFSHKLGEARAYDNLERERDGSVRIIQPPTAPPEPKRLQLLIILAGLFVSLLSFLGEAAVIEFFGTGFLIPERLERSLGLPVLAVLPHRR